MSKAFGIVARFESPAALTHACEALRDAGYKKFDAHTPFPVHGLEHAMGVGPSRLPWIVLGGGIAGLATGFALQSWVHIYGYPQIISGKPLFAIPAYIPIMFELTVLLSAFGCFFGLWGLCGLPRPFHPVMQHPTFVRATDDGFFISVEAIDPLYDAVRTRSLLAHAGGQEIEEVQP
jgi:hypothetical protein